MKKLLIGLMTLAISFQTFATTKTSYYPTGEVEEVEEHVDGEVSKVTIYYKTGEVKSVREFVDSKLSNVTI